MMIQETDTTTRSAASAIDTGYPMTGSSSWSVRRDSIQNLPIPYPARYSKKTSPSNRLCLVNRIRRIKRIREKRGMYLDIRDTIYFHHVLQQAVRHI